VQIIQLSERQLKWELFLGILSWRKSNDRHKFNSKRQGVQYGTYEIFGLNLFKIYYVIEPSPGYGTVECIDGTSNEKVY